MPGPNIFDFVLAGWLRRGWRGFLTMHQVREWCGGSRLIALRTKYGSVFALNPSSYVDRVILRDGYYESEVLEALRPHLVPGAVFWDVGANLGLHAITAARLAPAAQVFAFEPDPAMVARILENQRRSGVSLNVLTLALDAETRMAELHRGGEGNPGMSTLKPWGEAAYDSPIVVSCQRADELVRSGRVPAPTVAKIDVEGTEAEVLAGFGELLQRDSLKLIVFEAEPGLASVMGGHPIASRLHDAGFQLRELQRQEPTAHQLENYAAERR